MSKSRATSGAFRAIIIQTAAIPLNTHPNTPPTLTLPTTFPKDSNKSKEGHLKEAPTQTSICSNT